jgi:hypothetical protein
MESFLFYAAKGYQPLHTNQPAVSLNFLAASDGTHMAKRYALSAENGALSTTPYPHVRRFWSFARNATDLDQLYALLVAHGEAGHCLLKGQLDRPLRHEPRAGRTDPNALTDLLVLDLDFDKGFDSVDHFLEGIGLGGVSYVLHHSSSAGITAQPGLRAHVFVQLSSPLTPVQLKLWLRHLNLTVPGLREQAWLSANGMTLCYPLDVVSNQNDRLLFIADPTVQGMEDPLAGRRFELHMRESDSADLRLSHLDPGAVQREIDGLVAELRSAAGLPAREPRYVTLPGRERLLANPEPATVTGVRRARGFTYVRFRKSYAYYFPDSNPEFLYSFKGERPVRLADIAPGLWEQVRPRDPFAAVA